MAECRRTAEINLFSVDDYESMFAKYGINGLWSEEQFKRHEEIKVQLEKLNIPVPKWFDELSVRNYDYSVNKDEPFNYGRSLNHRRMSNNSVAFEEKPSKELLHLVFMMLQNEGEPAFVNFEEGSRRRPNFRGMNPCKPMCMAA